MRLDTTGRPAVVSRYIVKFDDGETKEGSFDRSELKHVIVSYELGKEI